MSKSYENRAATLASVIMLARLKACDEAPRDALNEKERRAAYLPRPYPLACAVGELIQHARALERLAVKACNEPMTARDEKQVERLRARCAEIADEYGFDVTTSGDPRGIVVKLVDRALPADNQGDGFGQDGWGVY